MKKMFTLSALAMMIVAGVFLWGCSKKSSPTAPPTTPQETIEISPNAVVIPDSTMNLLQNIDSTNFDLYYSQGTNIINNLQPGNIFISAKGEGMLRKVRSVVDSLGYTIVHTDSAKLEEVIINGSINIDVTMSPDKVKIIGIKKGVTITTDQKGDYSINFANVAVGWDPANNQPIIIDGNATMTPPNIKTGIKFTNGAVDTLAITVTATQTTNITMKTQGRVFAQGEVQLAEFVMAPITFWIGPVPIVFVPKFKVKLGGKAENEEAISAGVSLVTSETGGFKYKRVGGWLPIINYQQTFGHNVSVAGSAQGSSEITGFVLVPKFGMYFYSLTGPFVDMKFYGKYRYDYPGSYWAIYRGMAFDAGVESDIPGAFNLHYSFNILNFEQQLYNRTLKPRLSSPQNGAANVSVNPTLTWTTCPVATSYRLQVSTDIGFPSFIYNQSVSAASCQINGLSNNTIYYWRVNSSNSNGTSDWSDVWNFTTEAATSATVPTVTTTAASSITQTTATSGGNVTADGGAAVTARGVCWSTTANPTTANSHTSDGTGTGVFTSNITGLTAGTTYHVRAYATNSVGTSYGSDLTFTTTAGGSTTITWISISAGNFTMGSLPGDPYAQDNEQPQHTVYLDAYQISKYEITNSQYKDFMDAGGYSNSAYWTTEGWAWRTNNNITEPLWWSSGLYNSGPSFPNHPVVGVRWYEADAFCRWAGVHLPTEAQWEKAARGTDPTNYWPWGSTWDAGKCNCTYNTAPDTFEYSSPVGFFSAGQSPYGVYDMAGNVWEWCNDWYQSDYYSVSPSSNPAGPATGSYRVIRGGGWYIHDNPCRTVYRDPDGPVYRITHYVGFRPVK